MVDFRFPKPTQRAAIMGRTGSGKSQFGTWLLSHSNFDKQPWLIFDYKYDDLLTSIEGIREVSVGEVPKKPGLYIVHPTPNQEEEVEAYLWKIWERERIGLHIDEGYMLPNIGAFNAVLTQGRSKRIPMNILSQRPAWISRFVFSESDYFCVFHLNAAGDHKRVKEFIPNYSGQILPEYHSQWYDVSRNKLFYMKPVADKDAILQRFHERLKPKRHFV